MNRAIPVIFFALCIISACDNTRERMCCTDISIVMSDSLLTSPDEIKGRILKTYGCFIGQDIDSVGLARIEDELDSYSSVKKSEAWTTDDGVLHILISERKPVVKLDDGHNACYCDENGFVFPLGSGKAEVPEIIGANPVCAKWAGRGMPEDESVVTWIKGIAELVSGPWSAEMSEIRSESDGSLFIRLHSGDETYIWGQPDNLDDKLRKMDEYREYIKPKNNYDIVNLKYKGQIICRKDI